jgi:hypothetical protein
MHPIKDVPNDDAPNISQMQAPVRRAEKRNEVLRCYRPRCPQPA